MGSIFSLTVLAVFLVLFSFLVRPLVVAFSIVVELFVLVDTAVDSIVAPTWVDMVRSRSWLASVLALC